MPLLPPLISLGPRRAPLKKRRTASTSSRANVLGPEPLVELGLQRRNLLSSSFRDVLRAHPERPLAKSSAAKAHIGIETRVWIRGVVHRYAVAECRVGRSVRTLNKSFLVVALN